MNARHSRRRIAIFLIAIAVLAASIFAARTLHRSNATLALKATADLPTAAALAAPASQASPSDHAASKTPASKPKSSGARARLADIDVPAFARDYQSLAAAAGKGDAEAAYSLHRGTQACADLPTSAADLEGHLEDMKPSMSDEEYVATKAYLSGRFTACSTLTLDQRRSSRKWLEMAARMGQRDAAIAYVNTPPSRTDSADYWQELKTYRSLADELLTRELDSGSPDALLASSMAYGRNSLLYTPDGEKEYAYLYAYLLATDTKGGSLIDIAANHQSELSEDQLAKAAEEGRAIYSRCCHH